MVVYGVSGPHMQRAIYSLGAFLVAQITFLMPNRPNAQRVVAVGNESRLRPHFSHGSSQIRIHSENICHLF